MRRNGAPDLDSILEDALQPVIRDLSRAIATMIADTVAARLEAELPRQLVRAKRGRVATARRPRRELTAWVADRRARRVPTFVVQATGLATKKEIVARYGAGASFTKGKAPPPAVVSAAEQEPKTVKAKPPVIRKKGSVAA